MIVTPQSPSVGAALALLVEAPMLMLSFAAASHQLGRPIELHEAASRLAVRLLAFGTCHVAMWIQRRRTTAAAPRKLKQT